MSSQVSWGTAIVTPASTRTPRTRRRVNMVQKHFHDSTGCIDIEKHAYVYYVLLFGV